MGAWFKFANFINESSRDAATRVFEGSAPLEDSGRGVTGYIPITHAALERVDWLLGKRRVIASSSSRSGTSARNNLPDSPSIFNPVPISTRRSNNRLA